MPWEPTKIAGLVAAVGGALATAWGGADFIDTRYAKAPQVLLIEMRLDQKILMDRRDDLRRDVRDLEGRYGPDLFEAPGPLVERYRALKEELVDLDQEITGIQQEYRRQGHSANRYYERTKPILEK